MWYMRMILIYYILIPFIIYILRNIKQSIQIPIYIFLFIFSIFFYIIPSTSFSKYISYFLYLIIGYYMYNKFKKQFSKRIIVILFILSYTFSIYYQFISLKNDINNILWYDNVGVFIYSVILYEYFKQNKNKFISNNLITNISIMSLGIFFVHYPINILSVRYLSLFCNDLKFTAIMSCLLTFTISYLIVWVMAKNIQLSRFLFLIKK